MPDVSYTTTAAANGTATVTIKTRSRETWSVGQITVEATGAPDSATCVVRKNGALVCPLTAAADAAGGDPPIDLTPADVITVNWAGLTVNTACRVLAVYSKEGAR